MSPTSDVSNTVLFQDNTENGPIAGVPQEPFADDFSAHLCHPMEGCFRRGIRCALRRPGQKHACSTTREAARHT